MDHSIIVMIGYPRSKQLFCRLEALEQHLLLPIPLRALVRQHKKKTEPRIVKSV